MLHPYRPPFETILRATFIERPNRFVVNGRLDTGEVVRAFLPNPGRLQELLLPEATIFLVPEAPESKRKTRFTMVGVEGEDAPIFLHTHVNNDVARHLLVHNLVPGLAGATIVRAEVPLGRSRFDFLLEQDGAPIYVEVKSCTLFGNGVAMFPDAVTERGRRHLEELDELAASGIRTVVLFIVHSGNVHCFMPDYHTDPAFSATMLASRHRVSVIPMAVTWSDDFVIEESPRCLPVPWEYIAREAGDRGNWLLIGHVDGDAEWADGYYMLAGWCPDNLAARLRSLIRGGRNEVGDVRAVVAKSRSINVLPIVSSVDQGAALFAALEESLHCSPWPDLAFESPSSAAQRYCTCDPNALRAFHQVLARFRMATPEI